VNRPGLASVLPGVLMHDEGAFGLTADRRLIERIIDDMVTPAAVEPSPEHQPLQQVVPQEPLDVAAKADARAVRQAPECPVGEGDGEGVERRLPPHCASCPTGPCGV
jgi:hypothetical protein